jgi:tRNA-dihydrouridine synthase
VNAIETARILEGEGVRRLAVHGRTKAQGYTGQADWGVIAAVAAVVGIPVIGNGDIDSAAAALRRFREAGVAGVMIGRHAMSHPWIFREIRMALETGELEPEPVTAAERWAFVLEHARLETEWWGGKEELAMRSMRARFMAYTKGLPGGARLRSQLQSVSSLSELEEIAGEQGVEKLCGIRERE